MVPVMGLCRKCPTVRNTSCSPSSTVVQGNLRYVHASNRFRCLWAKRLDLQSPLSDWVRFAVKPLLPYRLSYFSSYISYSLLISSNESPSSSLLIGGGEKLRVLSMPLGHFTDGFPLRYLLHYLHLWFRIRREYAHWFAPSSPPESFRVLSYSRLSDM